MCFFKGQAIRIGSAHVWNFFNKLPGFRVDAAAKTLADNVCMGTFYLPASLSASDFKELAGSTQGSHNHMRDPSVSPS